VILTAIALPELVSELLPHPWEKIRKPKEKRIPHRIDGDWKVGFIVFFFHVIEHVEAECHSSWPGCCVVAVDVLCLKTNTISLCCAANALLF